MREIKIRLPENELEALDAEAARTLVPRSELIRIRLRTGHRVAPESYMRLVRDVHHASAGKLTHVEAESLVGLVITQLNSP